MSNNDANLLDQVEFRQIRHHHEIGKLQNVNVRPLSLSPVNCHSSMNLGYISGQLRS